MIKVEIPVEKLIDCHHNEMNERVKSQSSEAVKFSCAFFALILRQFNNKEYAYFLATKGGPKDANRITTPKSQA